MTRKFAPFFLMSTRVSSEVMFSGFRLARIIGNPKPDEILRRFAIDRLRRGCVELTTASRFYAVSRELRKLRRAETTRRCRLAISQPPDILHPTTGWLSIRSC